MQINNLTNSLLEFYYVEYADRLYEHQKDMGLNQNAMDKSLVPIGNHKIIKGKPKTNTAPFNPGNFYGEIGNFQNRCLH